MNIPEIILTTLAAVLATEFILMKFRIFSMQSRIYSEAAAMHQSRYILPELWKNTYMHPSQEITEKMQPGIMMVNEYGELKMVDYLILADHETVAVEQFNSQLSLN